MAKDKELTLTPKAKEFTTIKDALEPKETKDLGPELDALKEDTAGAVDAVAEAPEHPISAVIKDGYAEITVASGLSPVDRKEAAMVMINELKKL